MNRSSFDRGHPLRSLLATAVLVVAGAVPVSAQEPQAGGVEQADLLRVYLDCATHNCDRDRFRREITFVQWVREPQDGMLHVIMTSQSAGGGQQYVFDFEGRGELEGNVDRFTHTTSSTDVDEEVAQALTQTLRLGLVRYVAMAGFGDALRVDPLEGRPAGGPAPGQQVPEDDPWNFWVFSVSANAEIEREDRERSEEYRIFASANRTTEAWKLDLGFFSNWQRQEFEVDSTRTILNETDDWSADFVVVRSIDEHWSAGLSGDMGSSTRFNQDFAFEVLPAVEWNYYPWQDASRRRFVVLYAAGGQFVDYEEETIYEKTEEVLWKHRLDISYRAQETWGNARFGIEGNQVLDKPEFYSLEFQGNVSRRLFRGLEIDFGASYEVIRDQLYLSGAGLDPEEILLERRQLETGSRLSFEVGLSYRFGSIFNSTVNSRFAGVNGGFGGFGGGGGGFR